MTTKREPKLSQTLVDDLRRGDFHTSVSRDFHELREYMFNEERKKRLQQIGRLKRRFYFSWWLLKSLLLKLTPARRLLLAVAPLLILFQDTFNINGDNVCIDVNVNFLSGIILVLS